MVKTPASAIRETLPALERPDVRTAIKFAKRLRADSLLDIGCCNGEITLALSSVLQAREVYGIELERSFIEKSRSRGIQVLEMDVDYSDIPLQNECCDVVFCGEIIEHLLNIEHVLGEIRRVLKPGGSCILTTPNLACWYNRIALLGGFQPYISWVPWGHFFLSGPLQPQLTIGMGRPHISVMTVRALKELISSHGFQVRRLEGASARGSLLQFPFARLFFLCDELISRMPGLATFAVVEIGKDKSV